MKCGWGKNTDWKKLQQLPLTQVHVMVDHKLPIQLQISTKLSFSHYILLRVYLAN